LLLKPKKENKGPLARFFAWFNRIFGRTTDGYVRGSGLLIRKSGFALIILALVAVAAVLLGIAMQLAEAASLERSGDAAANVEKAVLKVPGVEGITSVIGYSLLSQTQSTYNSFFWVSLKDWDQRMQPNEQYTAIQANLSRALSRIKKESRSPLIPVYSGHRHLGRCHDDA
jgi:HAE1 family hydrophobic/amphiphilic exporter-1